MGPLGYTSKANRWAGAGLDIAGQTLVGSGLGGLMSIDSDSPMSWKHWGDGTIVGGATAAGAALGQRYGGTKGMIIGSMLGNAAGQGLSVGLGLRDQVSVEEIAMTGVTTAAFVGMGAAAAQAARVAVRAASAAAATAAGRAVTSAAGRAGTAISEAASGGARMIGRGLKHRYGEEAISNWVHGTMGKTIFHKPLEWAGTKAGLKVCFTAKMQLQLADGGWIGVADLRPGTMVASRAEHDENGIVAGRMVEEVFSRWGLVWEVNVDGKEIETTAEHPFKVAEQGWMAAHDLRVGDVVRLRDGWGKVEGVRDTGRWEQVYNCSVSEWHTYFVGEASWGWSVWAHNASYREKIVDDLEAKGATIDEAAVPYLDHATNEIATRPLSELSGGHALPKAAFKEAQAAFERTHGSSMTPAEIDGLHQVRDSINNLELNPTKFDGDVLAAYNVDQIPLSRDLHASRGNHFTIDPDWLKNWGILQELNAEAANAYLNGLRPGSAVVDHFTHFFARRGI